MLKESMVAKLNDQMNLEFYSSNIYLQMSAWCSDKALEGTAKFFRRHAQEEMTHMMRLFDYLDETGSMPKISAIPAPDCDYSSLKDVLEKAYEHEKLITRSINDLADVAMTNKDYSTFNFLQWYVEEQHEEEKLFKTILDRLLMVGSSSEGLYMLDNEIGNTVVTQATE